MPRPVEGSKVHHVPPPPPPVEKPKPQPVAQKQIANPDAGAASKKGEVENRGAANRQKIEAQAGENVAASSSAPNKSDSQQLVGAAVAGARGRQTAIRPATSTAERIGYAPRTAQANKAAQVFADTINDQIRAGKLPNYSDHNSIGAAIHKDGSITLSASGNGERTQHLYDEKLYDRPQEAPKTDAKPKAEPKKPLTDAEIEQLKQQGQGKTKAERQAEKQAARDAKAAQAAERQAQQKQLQDTIDKAPALRDEVQRRMNEAFEGDKTVKRRPNGDVDFAWGKADPQIKNLRESGVRDPKTGAVTPMTERNANNCAAGKMYQGENARGGKNPVVAADEVWRPSQPNSHADPIATNNPRNSSMCPCASCAGNVNKVTGGNLKRSLLTGNEALRSGATGAGVAAVTSTLQQLWDKKTLDPRQIDAGKLAQETAAGGATAVAGEAIERLSTPGVSRLANSVIRSGAGQKTIQTIGRVGTQILDNVPASARGLLGNIADRAPQSVRNFVGNTSLGKTLGDSRSLLSRATQGTSALESRILASGAGKIGGAGVAGAVIGVGVETVNQWGNLQNERTSAKAIGAIAAQGAVGLAAGASGAAVGAAIGTAIPIPLVGTAVGAAVGFGVGYLASKTGADKWVADKFESLASATGADKVVAEATKGVTDAAKGFANAASGAVNKLASVFGW